MPNSPGTIETIAQELTKLLQPLKDDLTPARAPYLFAELGFGLLPGQVASLSAPLGQTATHTRNLIEKSRELAAAIEADEIGDILQKGIEIVGIVKNVVDSFVGLRDGIAALSLSGITPEMIGAIPEKLFNYLLVRYIGRLRGITPVLSFLGVLVQTEQNEGSLDPAQPPYTRSEFHFNRFGDWLSRPGEQFRTMYQWGESTFDGAQLFTLVADALSRQGIPVLYDDSGGQPKLDLIFVEALAKTDVSPPGLALRLKNELNFDFTVSENDFDVSLEGAFSPPPGMEIVALPNGNLNFTPPPGGSVVSGELLFTLNVKKKGEPAPFILLGQTGGSRFEVLEFILRSGAELAWVADHAEGSFFIEGAANGCKIVIDASSGDGFLSSLLSGLNINADFDLLLGVASDRGLYFSGSSALEIRMPAHIALGPISIEGLTLALKFRDGKFPVELGADIRGELGPLVVVVQNMGVSATFSFPPNNSGNLGALQLDIGFKPPNGVGLSLDAGGFKGGGFLLFDYDKGEYVGALELDFNGMFSVKAIGIINTKMPDGSEGFSLLIVIAAEFTPIQLGFGFTLNGVGGIFGLNRSINVSALVDGIRTNAIKSILFPEDVVANITRIISDIKQFFPVEKDHFVIGPMAKLGWGTPSLLTVELGLLLDLPNPMVAIVGVIKAAIPAEEAPIIRLQVNFIGILDFQHGYIFFRADLYDSRLLLFTITGSMALLVSWGEQKTFAISVGGFHPDFRDIPSIPALPGGFNNMARIGISLLSDENPRLTIETYFAITSNTVQFGAKVELYAEAMGFNVYGFLGFDVLFQFDPFRFVARLYAGIALRSGTSVIAGINISAQLSGPTPWDAQGTASLELFWFLTISVSFHATWGDPPPAIEAASEDLMALLQKELSDIRNWKAEIPANNHLHVSIKEIKQPEEGELLVIHPAGILTFSQRSLPLENYRIDKFGTKKPQDDKQFKLSNADSNGTTIQADFQQVREQFAIANFTELSDSDKLSMDSFAALPSGFRLTGTSALQTTAPVDRPVEYELSYLRRKRLSAKRVIDLGKMLYQRLVKSNSVRQSPLSYQQTRPSLNAPPQVELPSEMFAIANVADLKAYQIADNTQVRFFSTQAEAWQQHQELVLVNPELAGQLQVVSNYELNLN